MKLSRKNIIRIAILILAIGLTFWGIAEGQAYAVFAKAVRICTECIGIG